MICWMCVQSGKIDDDDEDLRKDAYMDRAI